MKLSANDSKTNGKPRRMMCAQYIWQYQYQQMCFCILFCSNQFCCNLFCSSLLSHRCTVLLVSLSFVSGRLNWLIGELLQMVRADSQDSQQHYSSMPMTTDQPVQSHLFALIQFWVCCFAKLLNVLSFQFPFRVYFSYCKLI